MDARIGAAARSIGQLFQGWLDAAFARDLNAQ